MTLIQRTLHVASVMKASDRDNEVETGVAERRSQYVALLSSAGKVAETQAAVDHLHRSRCDVEPDIIRAVFGNTLPNRAVAEPHLEHAPAPHFGKRDIIFEIGIEREVPIVECAQRL